jgi:hypothetical protein
VETCLPVGWFVLEQELDSTGADINRDTNVDGLLICAPEGKITRIFPFLFLQKQD